MELPWQSLEGAAGAAGVGFLAVLGLFLAADAQEAFGGTAVATTEERLMKRPWKASRAEALAAFPTLLDGGF